MKKILTVVLAIITAAVVLTSCSGDASQETNPLHSEFSKTTIVASSDTQSVQFPHNARTTITEKQLVSVPFGGGNETTYSGNFSYNGVSMGDDLQAFVDALSIADEKGMFETSLVISADEILFNYPMYTQSVFEKFNFADYNDVFLTTGYYTENKDNADPEWKVLSYDDLYRIWTLELPHYKTLEMKDICIVSAGVDEEGKINMIDVYYGSLDSYIEKENYKVDVDYFATSEEESEESATPAENVEE